MAHDCAEEICEMGDDIEKEEEETVEEQADPATEAMEEDEDKDDDQGVQEDDDPVEVAENVQDFEESSRGEQQNQQPEEDIQRPSTSSRTFRVNSPSYQAVQHEFELFERDLT